MMMRRRKRRRRRTRTTMTTTMMIMMLTAALGPGQVEDVIGSRQERPKVEMVGNVVHILLNVIRVNSTAKLPVLQKEKVRGHAQNRADQPAINSGHAVNPIQ
jgi:hypothetical protein